MTIRQPALRQGANARIDEEDSWVSFPMFLHFMVPSYALYLFLSTMRRTFPMRQRRPELPFASPGFLVAGK